MKTTNLTVELSTLQPHPRNYNKHSTDQVNKLAAALKRFGQRKPITTWRNVVLLNCRTVKSSDLGRGCTGAKSGIMRARRLVSQPATSREKGSPILTRPL